MRLPVLKAGGEATGRSPAHSPAHPAQLTLSHPCLNDRLSIPTCLCLCSVKITSYTGAHPEASNDEREGDRRSGRHTQSRTAGQTPAGFTGTAADSPFLTHTHDL